MKKTKNIQNGFILITVLVLLTFVSLATQQFLRTMNLQISLDQTAQNVEQARFLALGGINIALAELAVQIQEPQKDAINLEPQGEKSENEAQKKIKKFLSELLPTLNRWQTFPLSALHDGVEGEIKICISCEDGKININKLFDFKKKEFSKEAKKILESINFKMPHLSFKPGEFLAKVTDFFKKRDRPLDDVSELLEIQGFDKFDLFYKPPQKSVKKDPTYIRPIAPGDLFTIFSKSEKIDPLVFSDALCFILGLRRPDANDAEGLKDTFQKIVSQFKPEMASDWKKNWSIIAQLYGKRPHHFDDLLKMLSQQFDPSVYTVISSGKVRGIEQKLLAVVMREQKEAQSALSKQEKGEEKNEKQPQKQEKKVTPRHEMQFVVVRLYWL